MEGLARSANPLANGRAGKFPLKRTSSTGCQNSSTCHSEPAAFSRRVRNLLFEAVSHATRARPFTATHPANDQLLARVTDVPRPTASFRAALALLIGHLNIAARSHISHRLIRAAIRESTNQPRHVVRANFQIQPTAVLRRLRQIFRAEIGHHVAENCRCAAPHPECRRQFLWHAARQNAESPEFPRPSRTFASLSKATRPPAQKYRAHETFC